MLMSRVIAACCAGAAMIAMSACSSSHDSGMIDGAGVDAEYRQEAATLTWPQGFPDPAMSRRRSNMGLAGEQSSECLGGREIA
ncbi:hypothetical protein, partial [Propionibacterium freudenreichii]